MSFNISRFVVDKIIILFIQVLVKYLTTKSEQSFSNELCLKDVNHY